MRKEEEMSDTTIVKFVQSGVEAAWDEDCESILELAEEAGLDLEYGCLFGDCASCMVALKKGKVAYEHEMMRPSDEGMCLPCCCKPEGGVVEIDA